MKRILFAAAILAAIGFSLIGRLFAATCAPVAYYGLPLVLTCGGSTFVYAKPDGVTYYGPTNWVIPTGLANDRIFFWSN
jgi:hypothetical protein